MQPRGDFVAAIATCLACSRSVTPQLLALVERVLQAPVEPTSAALAALQSEIDSALKAEQLADAIDLVYGGATKVKEYVFEAPKLPEIRGASTLLDWVNDQGVRQIWRAQLGELFGNSDLADNCVIYASGGNFLAFAPAGHGAALASAVEQLYTETTLTATSVAVAQPFQLLELRYGRKPLNYWVEDFERDWALPERKAALQGYYYGAEQSAAQRFFQRKNFAELVTLLNTRFYRRREEREQGEEQVAPEHEANRREPHILPRYELLMLAERCRTSGVRSASVDASSLGDSALLSVPSAFKAYIGRKLKRPEQPYEWFTEALRDQAKILRPVWEDGKTWEQRFQEDLPQTDYAASWSPAPQPAQDIGEIAQASQPARYIGLIYADGNNVARYMGQPKNPGDYAESAAKLTKAAQKAVFTALAKHLQPARVRTEHGQAARICPFEILAIGGDDMLLIVPGSKALDIALDMGIAFERIMGSEVACPPADRYQGAVREDHTRFMPVVGLSAGVVIAQENTPIFFMRNLAEQLLKSAKEKARRNRDDGAKEKARPNRDDSGAIDFMVLKSITMVTDTIATFREQALGDSAAPNAQTRRRTARPYTWHELDGLLHTVQALQATRFPRSQLYRLRRMLDAAQDAGVLVSSLEYLATRSRLSTYAATLLTHVESPWQRVNTPRGQPSGTPPWLRMQAGGWETIWPDLAEIYDFVGAAP